MANDKMICSNCGGEMNHHADKLVYLGKPEDTYQTYIDLGGVVEETHGCPSCGAVASRRAG